MTNPDLWHLTRSCAKWRNGTLLVAVLFLIGCRPHTERVQPIAHIARADTVPAGRHRCVILTMQDGTHVLTPGQHKPCAAAFQRWVQDHP